MDLLRKAALPLNGTRDDATGVIRACLQGERVGPSQIFGEFSRPFDDEQALDSAHYILSGLKSAKADTICDFLIKNIPPISDSPWKPRIDGIVYQDQAESGVIFGDSDRGWEVFRERYPGSHGIITFSRVGFDTDNSQALVCLGAQYGWLVGHGRYLLLQRCNDAWKIDAELRAWMS